MNYVHLHVSLLLLSLFVFLGRSEFHLELIQVVMRHGERVPMLKEMYPNDPYNVSVYEPWGLGQLTNKGKLTEYRIGIMLRERYNDFLGSIYHPRDIYAVSTDIDRTKMSLQLMLAGLYPPHPTQLWNPDLPWLAIPTHYTPKEVDIVLQPHNCPVYIAALEEVKKSKEVRDKIAFYKDFLTFLSEKTGLIITESLRAAQLSHLLTQQKNLDLTLPEWCTDEVYKKLQETMAFELELCSYTTQLKRLNGGMLIKKFIENLNITGKSRIPRKMYVYSAHELNIAAFAKAHNISEPRLPDYGSAFIFEKLRDDAGELYVRIILWTGKTEKLITVKLADCNELCPLKTYLELVRDVTPSDEETTCLWDNMTREELLKLFEERLFFN
ncbi:venom acid phosphatase Acph-1 isoform X4 [Linepithema humile]|uniref:venom acid phosphatase Acph-1 isoform X4 n=1 Tax=Linepithema humile TaxID=83485 RepID=UPI0006231345|nr:PREDICTED: venom acid phosphatase Acph-1-like [Linepithema humile]